MFRFGKLTSGSHARVSAGMLDAINKVQAVIEFSSPMPRPKSLRAQLIFPSGRFCCVTSSIWLSVLFSALVEENAATAKTLEQQAKTMDDEIGMFRLAGDDIKLTAAQKTFAWRRQGQSRFGALNGRGLKRRRRVAHSGTAGHPGSGFRARFYRRSGWYFDTASIGSAPIACDAVNFPT
jgi:hypothetical protein